MRLLLLIGCGLTAVLAGAPVRANLAPIIDDLRASATSVPPGGTVILTVDAHDPDCPDVCTTGCGQYIRSDGTLWSATGGSFISEEPGTNGSPYTATAEWQAPAEEGTYTINVYLIDSGSFLCGGRQSTDQNIDILVTGSTNSPPVIESLTAVPAQVFPGETSDLTCVASDPDEDPVTYSWEADSGTVTPGTGGTAVFTAGDPGPVVVTCTATDPGEAFDQDTVNISVVGAAAEKSIAPGLVTPQRLDIDSMGEIYVADRDGGGIRVLHLASGEPSYRIPLPDVRSVAVDWNDDLLVGRVGGAELRSRAGEPILALGTGPALGDVSDVAADGTRRRYGVLHRTAGRILVYDELGAQLAAFGSTGDGPDQLMSPQGLAVTPGGDWVVADSGHGLIKIFDLSGTLLSSFGAQGGGAGEFVQLDDVAVDADGIIWASDSFQDWVQAFNPDGTPREVLGTYGEGTGEFKTVTGLAPVPGSDRLLALSANSSRVEVFVTSSAPPPAGPLPGAELDRTSLVFAAQEVGLASATQAVVLSNTGQAPLGIRLVDLEGSFTQTNDCGDFVEPAGQCSFLVAFLPAAPGPHVGSMVIDTSAEGGALVVSLEGAGFVPAGVHLVPASLDFPDEYVGSVSDPVPVTLSNTGTVALDIESITASAGYLETGGCVGSLDAGASCLLQVQFAPEAVADHVLGTVTVTSSAPDSPHRVDLDGRGVPLRPDISVADVSVTEQDGSEAQARFLVTLSATNIAPVTVEYGTLPQTAVEGVDYGETLGTLTFEPGQTSLPVSVPIFGDTLLEPDEETFLLELTNPGNGILADDLGVGTILDDERCPGPNLPRNPGAEERPEGSGIPGWTQVSGADWQVRETSPEPQAGNRYFFAGTAETAELAQDVDVSAYADAIEAGGLRFLFEGWVHSQDEPIPDTARIVVEYRSWDNSTVLESFDSGEIESVLDWQRISEERVVPAGTSWIRLRLIATRNSGTDNDAYFDSLALLSLRSPTLVIADASGYEGDYGESEVVFALSLPCAYHRDVRVAYATADGTALAGEDYLLSGGEVPLPLGELSRTLGISLLPDEADEGHETFLVDLQVVSPDEIVPLDMRGEGTITNDDFCPRPVKYWARYTAEWPVEELTVGGVLYDRAGLHELLVYSGSDAASLLAAELVATRLNLARGSDPEILPTADQADSFLATFPPGSDPTGEDRSRARDLQDLLEGHNDGHCNSGSRGGTSMSTTTTGSFR